jgi:hypothetical protein
MRCIVATLPVDWHRCCVHSCCRRIRTAHLLQVACPTHPRASHNIQHPQAAMLLFVHRCCQHCQVSALGALCPVESSSCAQLLRSTTLQVLPLPRNAQVFVPPGVKVTPLSWTSSRAAGGTAGWLAGRLQVEWLLPRFTCLVMGASRLHAL